MLKDILGVFLILLDITTNYHTIIKLNPYDESSSILKPATVSYRVNGVREYTKDKQS